MMDKKTKLELTWIGKDERPRLEPRILLEDPDLSYHAAERVTDHDIFDNVLIQGDNLLALKALEQEYAGKVKCVFIDPPYNTGSAFAHYDDGIEHSLWLTMMRDRLEVLRRLMRADGTLWVTLDDNEYAYCKVLCDEIFGRSCFVTTVVWRSTDNSNNDAKQFSVDHNYVLIYSRTPDWQTYKSDSDSKRTHFKNPDGDPRGPWFDGNPLNSPKPRPNLRFDLVAPNGRIVTPPRNGWRWSRETLEEKIRSGEIRFTPDGSGIRRRTYLADMKGLPPSTLWAELQDTGHNRQAKYELKHLFPERPVSELFGTPKPERLLHKILVTATEPGDLVLDSFAGSGTTGAVAQKMGRRWIMIEMGEHARTDIVPRLKRVVDGEDAGGVTESTDWKGGGGFRFYRLAPSLLERDRYGNWVVSKQYNPAMLAEAMCKHEGFKYAPSDEVYWQQGHSTERDFIYVTTQTLGREQLAQLSDDVGPDRSLLVCCAAFRAKEDAFPNLTLKKIPNAVLHQCEWGRDDYSLAVSKLPAASQAPSEEAAVDPAAAVRSGRGRRGRRPSEPALELFEEPEP
jgi:adenine-specific DNA-methyltransferase